MRKPIRSTRAGFAIFAVIIGVLVLSALTLTALDMGTQETRSARATRVSASALYTAEAGVNAVRAAWPTTTIAAGDSLDLGWTTMSNAGKYRAWIHRRDIGVGRMQIYSLTVEGSSPGPNGGQAAVQVWATRFVTGLFQAAVSAKGDVTLNGNSFIDSYDSRLGLDYDAPLEGGGTNRGSNGSVLANGSLSMTSLTRIYGDATVGGTVSDPQYVSGTVTTGAPPAPYPVEACPPYTPTSGLSPAVYTMVGGKGMLTIHSESYTLHSGTYSIHDFTMSGQNPLLIIPSGNAVTLYISGEVKVAAQAQINNLSKNARSLSFISCNRNGLPVNTTSWSLAGGSGAYFTVYAPNNNVTLSGSGSVYGAIVAKDFTNQGGAAMHFDVALAESNTLSSIMSRSWRQLLR